MERNYTSADMANYSNPSAYNNYNGYGTLNGNGTFNGYNGFNGSFNGNGNGNGNCNGNCNGNGNGNGNGYPNCNITNTATAQGYYMPESGGTVIVSGEDSLTLGCIFADIAKTADRDSVNPGDMIRYTVTFRNMSGREMYNVKITDTVSEYLNVIATSIMPAPQAGESLETGITIGRVPSGSQRTLTFSARVTADVSDDIVNRAFADFSFRDADGMEQTASTHITSLTTPLENRQLHVEKTADKSFITSNGEEIVFTIRVHNNTPRVLGDVVVTDNLPDGLVYVEGTTSVNGDLPIDSDPAGGIYIGAMDTDSEATVQFTARVDL